MSLKENYNQTFLKNIFLNKSAKPNGRHKEFSVLLPLVYKAEEPYVLFEVRSDQLRKQPGEICFPGGKVEEGETTADCAIRETNEELNIPTERIELISELDYIYTYSNFTLNAFLGILDYEDVVKRGFNTDEVKDIFLVPLEFLLQVEPYAHTMSVRPDDTNFPYELIGQKEGNYNWRTGKTTVYIYHYEDKIIWGLTARILKSFIQAVRESQGG